MQDFVQYTRGHLKDLRGLARKSPAAWQVFTLLVERMNKSNAVVVSQATIAEILGYTRTTINSAVKLLEKEAWMQVVKIGQVNAYVINSKVVWRNHSGSGKRFSGFFAQIIASESEQNAPVEKWDNIELRHVPVLISGELPLVTDEDLPPPDQKDLLPPAPEEFPRTVGKSSARDWADFG